MKKRIFQLNSARFIIQLINISDISNSFIQIRSFPNILGCIDGTSINIRTPAHKIKSTYANRHDTPSIPLQGIL